MVLSSLKTMSSESSVDSAKGLNKNSRVFRPMFNHSEVEYMPSQESSSSDYFSEYYPQNSSFGRSINQMAVTDTTITLPSAESSVSASPVPSGVSTFISPLVDLAPPPGYDPIVEPAVESCTDYPLHSDYYSSGNSYLFRPPQAHNLGGYKLFVGALPYSVCEDDLYPLFGQFGHIIELHIQRDWLGRSKGCAWLRYSTSEECAEAISVLHNNYFLGSMNRPLQLTYASESWTDGCSRTNRASSYNNYSFSSQLSNTPTTEEASRPRALSEHSSVLNKVQSSWLVLIF